MAVISQAFWVGIAGIALSVPAILAVASIGSDLGAKVILPWWLWVGAVTITLTMAMISGLFALRSLQSGGEPVTLLRSLKLKPRAVPCERPISPSNRMSSKESGNPAADCGAYAGSPRRGRHIGQGRLGSGTIVKLGR